LVAPQVAEATGHPLSPGALAASTVVVAGAALLPDLDHEHGTLARALPPASRVLTELVADFSGGHATPLTRWCSAPAWARSPRSP
jgi:hypothetical protein